MRKPSKGAIQTSVTMDDVAKAAGVSRQLVSLVMRDVGYVSAERRAKVLKTAERLGYKRNTLAASLAGKRTNTVGLVVLDIHNQVFADYAEGVIEILEPEGYKMLLSLEGSATKTLEASIETLIGLRVDGILLASHVQIDQAVANLVAGTPTVSMGEGYPGGRIDLVHSDDETGLRIATEHLIAQGHKRILYIGGPTSQQNSGRRSGYRKAMQAAGLETYERKGDATEVGGSLAFVECLESGEIPTGVVCYNDATAIGVLAVAQQEKIPVPGKLAVTGYDNTQASGYPGVNLTSIDQHARSIGRHAAKLLLERIEAPNRGAVVEVLTPELIVRASSQSSVKS